MHPFFKRFKSPHLLHRPSYCWIRWLNVFLLSGVSIACDSSSTSNPPSVEMTVDQQVQGGDDLGVNSGGESMGGEQGGRMGENQGGENMGGENMGGEQGGQIGGNQNEEEPIECQGLRTQQDCLTLIGYTRSLNRQWSPLGEDSIHWGEPLPQEITPYFSSSTPPPFQNPISSELANGEDQITLTPLALHLPLQSTSVELQIQGLKADRLFQHGYQSWSFSGAIVPPSLLKMDDENHLFVQEAYTGDPLHGEHGVSFGLIAGQIGGREEGLKNPQSGVWLLGTLDPTQSVSVFGAKTSNRSEVDLDVIARIGFEDIPLQETPRIQLTSSTQPNTVKQEFVLITAPNMWLALRTYQHHLSTTLTQLNENQIRSTSVQLNPQKPLKGWYSWNERFEEIDEAYILDHIEEVSTSLLPFGFTLVEIDDGWQQGWGKWIPNDHFPNQFVNLIEQANQNQVQLGIWMAPFLVDVTVAESENYPLDWFVYPPPTSVPQTESDLIKPSLDEITTQNQTPLEHQIIGNPRTYYVLDPTHPQAMNHVLEQLGVLSQLGFVYFKLDFLYAGAIPGRRVQAISAMESLRMGLGLIRQALGEDAIINGCGAPVHGVLGYVDSMRIGSDTTFGDLYPAFIASAARSTAARSYLYPLFWPDGDQVQMREPYSIQEAQVGGYVAALSGPAYSIGDDLTQLSIERKELFTRSELVWWSNTVHPARPLDLMENPALRWFGNPLFDHAGQPNGTQAPPPQKWIAYDEQGQVRVLQFEWESSFNVQNITLDELSF